MNYKARKHIWPVALMSLAVFGVLAFVVALSAMQPQAAQADGCASITDPTKKAQCDARHRTAGLDHTDSAHSHGTGGGPSDTAGAAGDMIASSSTTASAGVELKLTIKRLGIRGAGGSSVELYLEDDFNVPDTIDRDTVYFTVSPATPDTNNGGRVYATDPIDIDTDGHFTQDKDDYAIRVLIPDMNTSDDADGHQGPMAGQTVTLVFTKSAGIKNPSEEGTHSVGYSVLGPNDDTNSGPRVKLDGVEGAGAPLETLAKIGLSDPDNKRGYEMTVTGSGFNDGTTAGVYVLHHPAGDPEDKSTWPSCEDIITRGVQVGGALVGSDDKVAVTFEVTAPTFKAGRMNYLCMGDGEGRMSSTDVEDFFLEPSIRVSPAEVSSGDTVRVFAQDFGGGNFGGLKLRGQVVNPRADVPTGANMLPYVPVSISGETAVFEMPGGLEGTVRVDATWGGVTKNTKITISPSIVSASKTDVLPNDSITLTGNGFASNACILASMITLEEVPVRLDDESNDSCGANGAEGVRTSNAGQFVATVHLAPVSDDDTNPTLIPGPRSLNVEDSKGFSGSVTLTIAEPTVKVTPDVAGPRDYIAITGENWPVDNPENPLSEAVKVMVNDAGNRAPRQYSAFADTAGRFTVEHQVHRGVTIPSTIQVEVKYDDVVKLATFDVPVATITVDPAEAQPGDTISISATNMPVHTGADQVKIGGSVIGSLDAHTDRDGNITVDDVLIPGLDPGTYSVQLTVKNTVAIGELKVLAESAAGGAPAELPGAVENLGDNLVAIFYFDDVGKEWAFYDPRPEFAELNTLTELVNGEAYWILVSETVEDVVLNNKARNLTCRGDDCWNLEVW